MFMVSCIMRGYQRSVINLFSQPLREILNYDNITLNEMSKTLFASDEITIYNTVFAVLVRHYYFN
jgi:hypothetical protein